MVLEVVDLAAFNPNPQRTVVSRDSPHVGPEHMGFHPRVVASKDIPAHFIMVFSVKNLEDLRILVLLPRVSNHFFIVGIETFSFSGTVFIFFLNGFHLVFKDCTTVEVLEFFIVHLAVLTYCTGDVGDTVVPSDD